MSEEIIPACGTVCFPAASCIAQANRTRQSISDISDIHTNPTRADQHHTHTCNHQQERTHIPPMHPPTWLTSQNTSFQKLHEFKRSNQAFKNLLPLASIVMVMHIQYLYYVTSTRLFEVFSYWTTTGGERDILYKNKREQKNLCQTEVGFLTESFPELHLHMCERSIYVHYACHILFLMLCKVIELEIIQDTSPGHNETDLLDKQD